MIFSYDTLHCYSWKIFLCWFADATCPPFTLILDVWYIQSLPSMLNLFMNEKKWKNYWFNCKLHYIYNFLDSCFGQYNNHYQAKIKNQYFIHLILANFLKQTNSLCYRLTTCWEVTRVFILSFDSVVTGLHIRTTTHSCNEMAIVISTLASLFIRLQYLPKVQLYKADS